MPINPLPFQRDSCETHPRLEGDARLLPIHDHRPQTLDLLFQPMGESKYLAISPPDVLQVCSERTYGTGSGWRTAVRIEGMSTVACVDAIDS